MKVSKLTSYIRSIIFFSCMFAVMFSVLRLTYMYVNENDFYCYIPEDLSINRIGDWSVCHVVTLNNTSLRIQTLDDLSVLNKYKGKYVVLTLAFGNSDDEHAYTKHIISIREQQNNTKLGYYPKGIDCWDYYHRRPAEMIDFIGLLGILPMTVMIAIDKVRMRRANG